MPDTPPTRAKLLLRVVLAAGVAAAALYYGPMGLAWAVNLTDAVGLSSIADGLYAAALRLEQWAGRGTFGMLAGGLGMLANDLWSRHRYYQLRREQIRIDQQARKRRSRAAESENHRQQPSVGA